jgi:hypothetical protein
MTRESSNKPSKQSKRTEESKKTEELKKKKTQNNDDSTSDNDEKSDSDSEEMDIQEYRKFISKIFPSKHMNNKIKAGEIIKSKSNILTVIVDPTSSDSCRICV